MGDENGAGDPDLTRTTLLLRRMRAGEEGASEELMPLVYATLHDLARRMMAGERRDHTLQPTALVHEAWLRLAGPLAPTAAESDGEPGEANLDRDHFLRIAARSMRRVLVDHARARGRDKRGGGRERKELLDDVASPEADGPRLLEFDEALGKLEAMDERMARIVELRFFAGYSAPETARLLDTSLRTVERGWTVARLFLAKELEGEDGR